MSNQVIYKGKYYKSMREFAKELTLPYHSLFYYMDKHDTLEEAVQALEHNNAKKLVKNIDYINSLDDYDRELLFRKAGIKRYQKITEDSVLAFRGITKTLSAWSVILGEDVNSLIERAYKFTKPSKILGVKQGRYLGNVRRRNRGTIDDRYYVRATNLLMVGNRILSTAEIKRIYGVTEKQLIKEAKLRGLKLHEIGRTLDSDKLSDSIWNHPLHRSWVKNKDLMCDEWLDYKTFYNQVLPHYVRGYSLVRINEEIPLGVGNIRFERHNKKNTKGVYKKGNRWVAKVWFNKSTKHLGSFLTEEEAIKEVEKFRGGISYGS